MNDPVQSSTTKDQIVVTWSALTQNAQTGASPITSYQLDWNQGSLIDTWIDL